MFKKEKVNLQKLISIEGLIAGIPFKLRGAASKFKFLSKKIATLQLIFNGDIVTKFLKNTFLYKVIFALRKKYVIILVENQEGVL